MNPDLSRLLPYPFERLAELKLGVSPPQDRPHIALSIGEPRHPTPVFIIEEVITHLHGLSSYPITRGGRELRAGICRWLTRRFQLPDGSLDPDTHVLPVNGTREALFAFAQAVVDRHRDAVVVMPNPFYQIYEGAALLAGARPWFVPSLEETGYLPDFDSVPTAVWEACQLLYLCSPGNPTGTVLGRKVLERLLSLADEHDFIIAADECYSEIYPREEQPPTGLLQVAAETGRDDFRRCVVFHSLSKRSNAPGLRSGFVAGDASVLGRFLLYRTYHGCTMPPHTQAASLRAWSDEDHVRHNRALYREKFDAVLEILNPVLAVEAPDAGFYLWPRTPGTDTEFARTLYAEQNITVLPGSFLSREVNGRNPGEGHVRMALVPPLEDCVDAARRIKDMVTGGG